MPLWLHDGFKSIQKCEIERNDKYQRETFVHSDISVIPQLRDYVAGNAMQSSQ